MQAAPRTSDPSLHIIYEHEDDVAVYCHICNLDMLIVVCAPFVLIDVDKDTSATHVMGICDRGDAESLTHTYSDNDIRCDVKWRFVWIYICTIMQDEEDNVAHSYLVTHIEVS
jgi:hypothetical protein